MRPRLQALRGSAGMAFVLTAGVAVAGGCAATASPSVAPTATLGATPAPTPSPTPVATTAPTSPPSASPAALALCATTGTPCPLKAGTYTTAPFVSPFQVTIGDGWTNDRAWAHGGELADPTGKGYLQWGSGFTGGTGPNGKTVVIGQTAADILDHLRSFKDFTVSPVEDVTIDGKPGKAIDVMANGAGIHGILQIPEDDYNMGPGETIRFMVFEGDGAPVVLMVDIPKEKDFDAEMATMQPILDSIVWK